MAFRSIDEARGYLAGLIDGEGTVGDQRCPSGPRRHVSIANTDPEIIMRALAACQMLGIRASVYHRADLPSRPDHWADCMDVRITGRSDLERIAELPLCPRKRERLQRLLAGYRVRYRRRGERPLSEIASRYHAGATISQLAKDFDSSRGTIHRWLVEADVTRRPRGGRRGEVI